MISKLEHPLEMLSTEEISLAYEIYKTSEDYDEATHFSQISLVEPTKELLKDFKPAFVIVFVWNITNEVKKQLSYIKKWGAKMYTLYPKIKKLI